MFKVSSSRIGWRATVLAIFLLLLAHESARAAGGMTFGLPLTMKNPSGLSIRIDSHGVDANGYRPVQVRVLPTNGKPFTFDRQLRVVLGLSKYGTNGQQKVSQIIELPEGSTGATATMLIPQAGSFHALMIETY